MLEQLRSIETKLGKLTLEEATKCRVGESGAHNGGDSKNSNHSGELHLTEYAR